MGLFNDDMTGLAAAYASMNDGKYCLQMQTRLEIHPHGKIDTK